MNRRHLYRFAIALSVFGLTLLAYKALVLGFPLTPGDVVQRWNLDARLRFAAEGVEATHRPPHRGEGLSGLAQTLEVCVRRRHKGPTLPWSLCITCCRLVVFIYIAGVTLSVPAVV